MPVILVTGAGGGIGSLLVDYLLTDKRHKILCQYRNHDQILRNVFNKHDLNFDEHCFKADLTSDEEVDLLHHFVNKNFGKLWALINLAGASTNAMSWKLTTSEFIKTINDNLLTTFLMCKEFIPDMREQENGRIVNVSSVVAFSGAVGASHYCAAKAGIVGFTKAIALELANKNITANVLGMGYFETGLIDKLSPQIQQIAKDKTPLKRFGKVSELGGLVNYLLSEEASFVTGQVLHVNGGIYL